MKNVNYVVLLEQIMNGNGLTQEQLGKAIGVSKQYVSQLLSGKRNVGKGILAKLTESFPDYIEDVSSEITPNDLKELRKKYKLSQEKFADFLGVSQSLYSKCEAGQRSITDKLQEKIMSLDLSSKCAKTAPKPTVVPIKYCPDVQLPTNCNFYQRTNEYVYIDEKLLFADKNININPNKCFILSMLASPTTCVYGVGDKIILDTSHKSFKNDYTFAFKINGQCYIRKINILPNKVKCISIEDDQDTFYLDDVNDVEILGLIVPRIRF